MKIVRTKFCGNRTREVWIQYIEVLDVGAIEKQSRRGKKKNEGGIKRKKKGFKEI